MEIFKYLTLPTLTLKIMLRSAHKSGDSTPAFSVCGSFPLRGLSWQEITITDQKMEISYQRKKKQLYYTKTDLKK